MNANDKEHLMFLINQLHELIEHNSDNSAIYCCVVTDFNVQNRTHLKSVLMLGQENILDQAINNATDYALDFYTK